LPFKFANGAIVTHPLLPRHAAIAGAVVLLSLTPAFAAETPTPQELLHATTSGSYLAARHAGVERDSATAAAYYLNVLKADPHNADLLSRTFLSVLSEGDIDEAGRLADRLVQVDHNDRIARLVLGVRALKQKQYAAARQNFAQSVRGPVTDLTAALLSAWALAGAGDTRGAVDTLDKLTGPDWYAIFKDLHAGLILDVANNKKDAGKRYERSYKADAMAVRTVEAYGRYLSRNGSKEDALKVYRDFDKAVPNHPVTVEEMKEVAAGEKLPPLADSPPAGAAEALYGLGASIGRRGGEDLALIYLQLALYLEPTHAMALLSLAVVTASPQRRNPDCLRPRYARSHRRGQEAARTTGRRASERQRSDHGARQHPARPQAIRRMRRCLRQGHRRRAGAR
jgi:tetratricopeptide (TPR) repeat protein